MARDAERSEPDPRSEANAIKRDCRLIATAVVERMEHGTVTLRPQTACAGCSGTCLWKRAGTFTIPRPARMAAIRSGDRVDVSLPERFTLLAAAVAYGLPLAGLLGGAAAAAWLDPRDGIVLIGALAGCAAACLAARRFRRVLEQSALASCAISRAAESAC